MRPSVKRIKAEPPQVTCGWIDCSTSCRDEAQLNEHIENHLQQYLAFFSGASTADVGGGGGHQCPWNKCDFQTQCDEEFQRHVYYHGYYCCLLVQGAHECAANPSVPKCSAPPMETDKIPELKADFRCEWTDCERTFASIVEFQDHIVQHASFEYEIQKSPDDERPKIQCNWSYCRKLLDNKYRLIEHIRTHSNKKQVACAHCGELFRTKTTLFDHLRRQPDNNTHQFQCAQCFKSFATEKLLRSHVVKHVNCYKCTMCDMTCSSSSSLATHIRYRHLKDKPFKCTDCAHRCVRKSDLAKHVEYVHNKGVLSCVQPGCNYAVRTYNQLRRHFLEVHGNSPFIYICHCCNKPFKNGKSLSSHLIKKHNFQLPSGHKRFTYRVDENGFYRLETMRIESLEVTKQILSPNPFEVSDITQDSSCYEIVSMTNHHDERFIVSNDAAEARLVGEVVISLPEL